MTVNNVSLNAFSLCFRLFCNGILKYILFITGIPERNLTVSTSPLPFQDNLFLPVLVMSVMFIFLNDTYLLPFRMGTCLYCIYLI